MCSELVTKPGHNQLDSCEDFSLEFSLPLPPNKDGQLSVCLVVKSDQSKVNKQAEGGMGEWIDGWMEE